MAATLVWLLILSQQDIVGGETVFVLPKNAVLKALAFAVAVTLGIVERLSSSGNLISMERDWVVAVAAPAGQPYCLTDLNAVMRRIDLVCKLIAPIFISVVISAVGSMRIGVVYTGVTSLICLPIELFSAKKVWNSSNALQQPKPRPEPSAGESDARLSPAAQSRSWTSLLLRQFKGLELYFSTSVWLPSLTLSMLHYNMLTWRATFITYLINAGYTLNFITIARTLGSIFEIGSTILTPIGIRYAGAALHHEATERRYRDEDEAAVAFIRQSETEEFDGETEKTLEAQTVIGLERLGLWGFSLQMTMLVRTPPPGLLVQITPHDSRN